jgi:hypothetical protein
MASKEKSGGVLARRDTFLSSMRKLTFEDGFFTAAEIAEVCDTPRSTAQDWINRLLAEGCIFLKENSTAGLRQNTHRAQPCLKRPANGFLRPYAAMM